MDKKAGIKGYVFLAIILTLIVSAVYFSVKPRKHDDLAKCLTSKGMVMYGTYWCPHCKEQKAMFGSSFNLINYVECTEKEQLCEEKEIRGYPTWIDADEKQYPGVKSIEELKKIAGC